MGRVEQQDSKLRKLMAAINRIGSHANSAVAVKKLQKTSKRMISLGMRKEEEIISSKELTAAKKLHSAMKKLTGRLVRQLMAQFEKELSHAKAERERRVERQDSKLRKLMAAIDRRGSHVNSAGLAMRKEEEIISSKELTAAKKLHIAMKKLTGRLVRQLMAKFEKELSHAKAEHEHRVEQKDFKLRKL